LTKPTPIQSSKPFGYGPNFLAFNAISRIKPLDTKPRKAKKSKNEEEDGSLNSLPLPHSLTLLMFTLYSFTVVSLSLSLSLSPLSLCVSAQCSSIFFGSIYLCLSLTIEFYVEQVLWISDEAHERNWFGSSFSASHWPPWHRFPVLLQCLRL
jgi:hypothetical protein